jgi:hypothetical protein
MEIKLKLYGQSVLSQLIEQCGEYSRKKLTPKDSRMQDKRWTRTHYIVIGDKFNVTVDGYREDEVTLQIKPERTL